MRATVPRRRSGARAETRIESDSADDPPPRGDTMPQCRRLTGDGTDAGRAGCGHHVVIKARLAFFSAERALVKASADYEKARTEYERACAKLGLAPHYAPESPGKG